jgi:hypothetical protein
MSQPVGYQPGIEFGGLAITEHDNELAAIGTNALQRMREPRRKVPKVTDADVLYTRPPVSVHDRNAALAVGHDGPFCGPVPVQFPDAAGSQPHIHTGEIVGKWKIRFGQLTGPSAILNPLVRIVERRPELRKVADIRRRRTGGIRELRYQRGVLRPGIGATCGVGVDRTLRWRIRVAKRGGRSRGDRGD